MKAELESYSLDNGTRIVLENIPHRSSATMGIWIPQGSRLENSSELGYSHFTEHMLFKGTENRSYTDISKEIDRLGGYMNASTSREVTNYYITLSSKHINTGLDVLSDMYYNSVFADTEFNVEKKVIIEEIKMGEDNPDEYMFDLFYLDSYGDSPIGRNIAGTLQSITNSTRDQLDDFYQKSYGPEGSVISLAGALYNSDPAKDRLKKQLAKFFDKNDSRLKGKPNL